jgi:alkanesulfonate monooxygenase SsuD/methylene tetrahydromethanopterin reductase-like flavin-dependent oxidoreductase (luciferase family)
MLESIDTVLKLWSGEKVSVKNGSGESIEVSVLPRPVQARPPIWIASAGSVDTFKLAGRLGFNVLTNMLGQDLADLKNKLAAYREARAAHGFEGAGQVTVMLHTFVCGDTEEARQRAR